MRLMHTAREDVPSTDILFQSGFWAAFRHDGRTEALTFTLSFDGPDAPLIVPLVALIRPGVDGARYAYVPHGPAVDLADGEHGPFLEELSCLLRDALPDDVSCVRYDTLFSSPYSDGGLPPRAELRELRMNFGTRHHALKKSPTDYLCPDTVVIDLSGSEEEILSRMRQTTRNCMRRSWKSGVEYRIRDAGWLGIWHRLYADTARRKNFYREGLPYFERLFSLAAARASSGDPEFRILSAEKDGVPLAGIIIAVSGTRGYYLYAGSSESGRECMPNYGLQWEAMRLLRGAGCALYDLMGVPPNNDPHHSMYGLYTFKTGLGGRVVHRGGCWDYPFKQGRYARMVNAEAARM